jgi:hypothetical protein
VKQPKGRKALLWLFVLLAAAGLLVSLALRPVGNDAREALTKHLAELRTQAGLRKVPRSVLTGSADPGNAWDEYDLALNDTAAWQNDENGGLFLRFVKGDTRLNPLEVERLTASHAEAFAHFRRGAHRSEGEYPYKWDQGSVMALPSLRGCRRLAALAAAEATIQADAGHAQEAVDILMDTSVFARDLAAGGPLLTHLIALVVYSTAFDGLRSVILSGKLTKEQLVDLGRRLETVDHDFPIMSSALLAETLGVGSSMLQASEKGPLEWLDLRKQWGWRFALTPGPSMLEAIEESDTFLHRAEEVEQMNFAEAKKRLDQFSAEAAASSGARGRLPEPDLLKSLVSQRETLAHLRLLRAATAVLATGEMPAIADPFGENLRFKREGNESKIWSIGSDGVDQNGTGNWEGRPDVVIELH